MSGKQREYEYVLRIMEWPQSPLEKKLIEEYLLDKGYNLHDLQKLPKAKSKLLMTEACRYASLKLAEIESKARLREGIRE